MFGGHNTCVESRRRVRREAASRNAGGTGGGRGFAYAGTCVCVCDRIVVVEFANLRIRTPEWIGERAHTRNYSDSAPSFCYGFGFGIPEEIDFGRQHADAVRT